MEISLLWFCFVLFYRGSFIASAEEGAVKGYNVKVLWGRWVTNCFAVVTTVVL